MILSDSDIFGSIVAGEIYIQPFDLSYVQPATYDIHLGREFLIPSPTGPNWSMKPIDPLDSESQDEMVLCCLGQGEKFQLPINGFALGTTAEMIGLPDDITARIEGKSSLGRIGLAVHITAGFIDPGFQGKITLELCNFRERPILLTPGMAIAQISFLKMTQSATVPYGSESSSSRYQGQLTVTPSRYSNGASQLIKDNSW